MNGGLLINGLEVGQHLEQTNDIKSAGSQLSMVSVENRLRTGASWRVVSAWDGMLRVLIIGRLQDSGTSPLVLVIPRWRGVNAEYVVLQQFIVCSG